METSEEVYSRSIIKNILDELAEDIQPIDNYGLTELLLEAELKVYKIAFPNIDMDIVETMVREYLYHHNYLEYTHISEGKLEYSVDWDADALYIKLTDDLIGEYESTVECGGGFLIDVDKNGLVRGVELLGVKDWFQFKEGEEIYGVNVNVKVCSDVVKVNVWFNVRGIGDVYGRLRQWFGLLLHNEGYTGDYDGVYCVHSWVKE